LRLLEIVRNSSPLTLAALEITECQSIIKGRSRAGWIGALKCEVIFRRALSQIQRHVDQIITSLSGHKTFLDALLKATAEING
jgi:hypothetical protein